MRYSNIQDGSINIFTARILIKRCLKLPLHHFLDFIWSWQYGKAKMNPIKAKTEADCLKVNQEPITSS